MVIYFGLFGLTILLYFLSIFKKDKNFYLVGFTLVFYYAFMMAGLRYGVAADYWAYKDMYNSAPPLFLAYSFEEVISSYEYIHGEFGYLFFNSFFKGIGFSYNAFLLLWSFMTLFFITISIHYFKINNFLAFAIYLGLFYFGSTFGLIRHGMVISLVFLSFKYVIERKLFKFVFLILLAGTIHKVALLFLVIYFLYFKVTYLRSFILICLAIIFFENRLLSEAIIAIFNEDTRIFLQLSSYYKSDAYTSASLPVSGLMLHIALLIIFIYYQEKFFNLKMYNTFKRLLFIYLLGILFFIGFRELSILSVRISQIMTISIIVLIPYVLQIEKKLLNKLLLTIFFISILFFKFAETTIGTEAQSHHYKTILY